MLNGNRGLNSLNGTTMLPGGVYWTERPPFMKRRTFIWVIGIPLSVFFVLPSLVFVVIFPNGLNLYSQYTSIIIREESISIFPIGDLLYAM